MIQIFGHPKCKATRAAQRYFLERGIKVQNVDLREQGLSKGELESVATAAGGAAALWDGAGRRVKDRGLQHIEQTEARLMSLLLEDPLLARTPIVRLGARATVGLDEPGWKALAEEAKTAALR